MWLLHRSDDWFVDGVLSTVLAADIAEWVVRFGGSIPESAKQAFTETCEMFLASETEMNDVVATGFLEALVTHVDNGLVTVKELSPFV